MGSDGHIDRLPIRRSPRVVGSSSQAAEIKAASSAVRTNLVFIVISPFNPWIALEPVANIHPSFIERPPNEQLAVRNSRRDFSKLIFQPTFTLIICPNVCPFIERSTATKATAYNSRVRNCARPYPKLQSAFVLLVMETITSLGSIAQRSFNARHNSA